MLHFYLLLLYGEIIPDFVINFYPKGFKFLFFLIEELG